MKSLEIKHFLFSRGDEQCIYLYTNNSSQNGNVADGSHRYAELRFVDGELPENIFKNDRWQIHFPISMYEWAVDLLMTKNPVYLNWDKSKKRLFLSSNNESIAEEVSHSIKKTSPVFQAG